MPSRTVWSIVAVIAALLAALWPSLVALIPPRLPTATLFATTGSARSAAEHCRKLSHPALRFCEDVVKEGEGYLATCDEHRGRWNTVMGPLAQPRPGGKLVRVDAEGHARELNLVGPAYDLNDFHPLGLHLSASSLWVVNHRANASLLTEFRLDSDSAHFLRHAWSPLICTPNAIASLSEDLLLVTEDHLVSRRSSAILQVAETALRLPGGSVSLVDVRNTRARTLASRIAFANGIVYLPSSNLMVVASTSRSSILVYRLTSPTSYEDARATFLREISLGFHVDNLSSLSDFTVLAAGHPYSPAMLKVSLDPYAEGAERRKSGSQVAVVDIETGTARTVFLDDGTYFRSSSTAVGNAKKLVVSGLYEDGLLLCEDVDL